MRRRSLTILLIGIALGGAAWAARWARSAPEPRVTLRTGDIVLQSSHSRQARWIEKATDSLYSHVGLIDVTPSGPVVIEAVEPVKRTPWHEWWQRGRDHRVTILRGDLSETQGRAVVAAANGFVGRHYDAQFDWDDRRIYCSELVWKAYDTGAHIQLGERQRLAALRLKGMESALRERFGARLPADRLLITPASIAADPTLRRVWSSYPP